MVLQSIISMSHFFLQLLLHFLSLCLSQTHTHTIFLQFLLRAGVFIQIGSKYHRAGNFEDCRHWHHSAIYSHLAIIDKKNINNNDNSIVMLFITFVIFLSSVCVPIFLSYTEWNCILLCWCYSLQQSVVILKCYYDLTAMVTVYMYFVCDCQK